MMDFNVRGAVSRLHMEGTTSVSADSRKMTPNGNQPTDSPSCSCWHRSIPQCCMPDRIRRNSSRLCAYRPMSAKSQPGTHDAQRTLIFSIFHDIAFLIPEVRHERMKRSSERPSPVSMGNLVRPATSVPPSAAFLMTSFELGPDEV